MKHNYGFTPVTSKDIASAVLVPNSDMRYAVTGDFMDIAKNHCCATMATNVLTYYHIPAANTRVQFERAHRFIGNGPVFRPKRALDRLFAAHHIPLTCNQLWRTSPAAGGIEPLHRLLTHEIECGRPCGILLSADLFAWHWVLCMGYDRTPGGTPRYFISDSWHSDRLWIYEPDHPSRFHAVLTFHTVLL